MRAGCLTTDVFPEGRISLYGRVRSHFRRCTLVLEERPQKYPAVEKPGFLDEMAAYAAGQEVPRFDQQGEFAGKTKGRKPKNTEPGKPAAKAKAKAKCLGNSKAESSKASSGSKARPKAMKSRKGKEKGKAAKSVASSKPAGKAKAKARKNSKTQGKREEAALPAPSPAVERSRKAVKRPRADGASMADECMKPPAHVSLNHVYSSAYRKALSESKCKEHAKLQARKATKLFSETGMVNHLCGQFNAAPRAKNCD